MAATQKLWARPLGGGLCVAGVCWWRRSGLYVAGWGVDSGLCVPMCKCAGVRVCQDGESLGG